MMSQCRGLRDLCREVSCRQDQCCPAGDCVRPLGRTECAGACRDFDSDSQHCGGLRHACPGLKTCQRGVCGCAAPLVECARNGYRTAHFA